MLRTGLLSVSSTPRIAMDQSCVVIREALPSDLATIETLLNASDLPTVGVADALDHFLLAEHEGRVIGAIGMELHGKFALLRSAVISEAFRGTGVGARLVVALLQRADETSLSELYLLTTTAECYFPKFGFATLARSDVPEVVRQSVEFRGACPSTAVAMRRQRPPGPLLVS